MPFDLSVPLGQNENLNVTLDAGEILFVLGANGTGKSSLMHKFTAQHRGSVRRISAHRQTWFSSNTLNLSPEQKRSTEQHIISSDHAAASRWKDDYSSHRPTIAIYDIIDSENIRARGIAAAFEGGDIELAAKLTKKDAPVGVINELLRLSNIPIEISIHKNDEVVAKKEGGDYYSIAELSDGERSALLIAAEVLSAKPNTLLIIDEPERHLHRSIISPLITHLMGRRPDCSFVISTHEVMLPIDNPRSRCLLVRSCVYNQKTVESWAADLVPSGEGVDEELRRDILGARRRILFVEGTEGSLDKPLYSILFPDVSVVAKSGCRSVEQAVVGVGGAAEYHWVQACGLVDNDRRSAEDISRLEERGVYAVRIYSVESVYYHPEMQRAAAERHGEVTGGNADRSIAEASDAAIKIVAKHVTRLCERAVERQLREEVMGRPPTRDEIASRATIELSLDIAGVVAAEEEALSKALQNGDLEYVFAKYPVRETGALNAIAERLGFTGRSQYESTVRQLLMDDRNIRKNVQTWFGGLPAALGVV